MIQIVETAGKLRVDSPYHPDFPARAKKIGGRWDAASKRWTFDTRDRDRVAALCREVFGSDGTEPSGDVLTIRAPACICEGRHATFGGSRPTSYWLAGREIARAFGRDSGAKLGDGVVIVSGGFSSGGSVKNPSCTYRDGTVFEVRDVPRAAAEKVHAEFHGVMLLDAAGTIIAEATRGEEETPADPEIDAALARKQIEIEIASIEGRAAGLRFRLAEMAAA